MRKIALIMLISLLTTQLVCADKLSRKERQAQKAAEIKSLVELGNYEFIARTAQPMQGRQINLTSDYDLEIKGDSAFAYLPYFGRAYTPNYGSTDSGVKFKEKADNFKLDYDEKKKSYRLTFTVKDSKESYQVNLSFGETGYGVLFISFNNRQSISYSGTIGKLPQKED